MAHNKVVIDVEARFLDGVSGAIKGATGALQKFDDVVEETKDDIKEIENAKVKPKIDADNDAALKKIKDVDNKLEKVRHSKTEVVLKALDKASATIGKVLNKGRLFANKTFTAMMRLKDSGAIQTINKITSGAENLTRKTWRVGVSILDKATAPLRTIKNMLFSIKGVVAAITAGLAAKQFIMEPIALADAYSSAKIGFSTLLGESQGQQMMNDLDAFAKATPFKSSEVIAQTQRMLAMGWDAEQIIDDMGTIGDAAAATGKGEQGLQQIVTALAQIKTKGKLSTEELNQLAEAGIAAKKYIAEGLGYGSGDEGIGKMTKDLEKGAITSGKALEALLGGMKEYQGMMDKTANETVQGLWSQIEDTFEINIFRRWGQGLQDGAKDAFGSLVTLIDEADGALDKFGDTLYEVGKTVSNWAADKFHNAVERITEITGSFDFKEASLGKKISMLWKGVIVDPIKEWWENGGRDKTAESAGKVGAWMGEMLSKGLLAIFGATDALVDSDIGENGGMTIAQSFVKGFKDNFDGQAITDAFVDAVKNVWNALPTWGKILLGGYVGGKAIGGAANVIGGIGMIGSGIMNTIGATGVAGVGASGLLGKLSTAGYGILGGTSALSVGGGVAALAGAAGIAGGAAGLASAGKGIYDLYGSYKAYKAGDTIEADAKGVSGGTALSGVAAGAGIGAMVGGPLGALIGAGVGGVAGWFGGKKWANNIREAKYEIEGTAEAIEKAETAEEKLAALNEAAFESMKSHMGDIKLSAAEIERIADQIVWGDDLGDFDKFTAAVNGAKQSLQSLRTATDNTNKWMWKASLGVKFNDDEIEAIKLSFDEYINAAKSYVENKHYEFTAAVSMLVDVETEEGKAIIDSGNAFYGKLQKQLEDLGSKLSSKVEIALKDGVITLDEQAEITNLQNQIQTITNKLAEAESNAEMELIKVKFGGGKLDLDSFDAFMKQMETTVQERLTANDEAFTASVASLQLQLKEGAITEDEYNKQLKTLTDGYEGKVDNIKAEVQKVELEIIGEAYAEELGGDMNEVKKKLESALQKSLEQGINPIEWTPDQARKFLGVDSLKDDTAKAISTMLGSVANQIEIVEVDGKVVLKINAEKEIQNKVDIVAEEFGVPKEHAETVAMLLYGDKNILNQIDVSQLAAEFGIPESQAKTIIEKLTGQKSIENRVNVLASDFGIPDVINKTVQIKIKGSVTTVGNPKMDYASKQAQLFNQEGPGQYRGGIVGGESAMDQFARGGRTDNSGIVGGSTRFIRVNEEAPEMIIPLSSQRRERALKLWNKTGELLNVPGFARGGTTSKFSDEGYRLQRNEDDDAPKGGGNQTITVSIGSIPVQISVNGDGDIVEAIKAQSGEIAEAVAGVIADELGAMFENTPTRKGA